MARNIEIKARIDNLQALAQTLAGMAKSEPVSIVQDDTFFACPAGRLKLRALPNGTGQLIFYRRPDLPGPKESFYQLSPTHAPDALRATLALAYGTAGRVQKQRTVTMLGRTRVHLDRVEGLGDFMELEVVLQEGESAQAGVQEAQAILAQLGVHLSQCVEGAYVDLLAHKDATGPVG